MPPVLRSFTVFQDTPSTEEPPAPKLAKQAFPPKRVTRSLSSKSEIFVYPDAAPIAALDKENLHPVTGERAGLAAAEKKRKDDSHILATKLHNPPTQPVAAKKHKKEQSIVLKDEGSPTKKRKASASSNAAVNSGTSQKVLKAKVSITNKESSGTVKSRKVTSVKRAMTRTRAAPSLPKVTEEDPAAVENNELRELKVKSKKPAMKSVTKSAQPHLSQADIDSRCYELTVKPLADVSKAYEDSSPSQDVKASEDKAKFQTVKERSAEPEIRDYFAPPVANTTNSQLGSSRKSPFGEPTGSTKTFSTPERKAIYAAFTFSSPSPSGKRFSKTSRTGGIPRLELA